MVHGMASKCRQRAVRHAAAISHARRAAARHTSRRCAKPEALRARADTSAGGKLRGLRARTLSRRVAGASARLSPRARDRERSRPSLDARRRRRENFVDGHGKKGRRAQFGRRPHRRRSLPPCAEVGRGRRAWVAENHSTTPAFRSGSAPRSSTAAARPLERSASAEVAGASGSSANLRRLPRHRAVAARDRGSRAGTRQDDVVGVVELHERRVRALSRPRPRRRAAARRRRARARASRMRRRRWRHTRSSTASRVSPRRVDAPQGAPRRRCLDRRGERLRLQPPVASSRTALRRRCTRSALASIVASATARRPPSAAERVGAVPDSAIIVSSGGHRAPSRAPPGPPRGPPSAPPPSPSGGGALQPRLERRALEAHREAVEPPRLRAARARPAARAPPSPTTAPTWRRRPCTRARRSTPARSRFEEARDAADLLRPRQREAERARQRDLAGIDAATTDAAGVDQLARRAA